MGWADRHIAALREGRTVSFRPSGHSMEPRIGHRQLVTVEPISSFYALKLDDVVLCRVAGHQYVHIVKQTDPANQRVLIANNRGRENGWTSFTNVYGRVTKVEP